MEDWDPTLRATTPGRLRRRTPAHRGEPDIHIRTRRDAEIVAWQLAVQPITIDPQAIEQAGAEMFRIEQDDGNTEITPE